MMDYDLPPIDCVITEDRYGDCGCECNRVDYCEFCGNRAKYELDSERYCKYCLKITLDEMMECYDVKEEWLNYMSIWDKADFLGLELVEL